MQGTLGNVVQLCALPASFHHRPLAPSRPLASPHLSLLFHPLWPWPCRTHPPTLSYIHRPASSSGHKPTPKKRPVPADQRGTQNRFISHKFIQPQHAAEDKSGDSSGRGQGASPAAFSSIHPGKYRHTAGIKYGELWTRRRYGQRQKGW